MLCLCSCVCLRLAVGPMFLRLAVGPMCLRLAVEPLFSLAANPLLCINKNTCVMCVLCVVYALCCDVCLIRICKHAKTNINVVFCA